MQAIKDVYEVRPRKDKRGVDLISDVLPFGRLWYDMQRFVTTVGGVGTLGVDTTVYRPTTRTLTIAGTTSDLSANRTWILAKQTIHGKLG